MFTFAINYTAKKIIISHTQLLIVNLHLTQRLVHILTRLILSKIFMNHVKATLVTFLPKLNFLQLPQFLINTTEIYYFDKTYLRTSLQLQPIFRSCTAVAFCK